MVIIMIGSNMTVLRAMDLYGCECWLLDYMILIYKLWLIDCSLSVYFYVWLDSSANNGCQL